MAGWLKSHYPDCRIIFLGRGYTSAVVALSEHVDRFVNYDEVSALGAADRVRLIRSLNADIIFHVFPLREIAFLARRAGIPERVGTLSRLYHWFTCNRLIRLPRRNSSLHEAQLNLKMLQVYGNVPVTPLSDIPRFYGFTRMPARAPHQPLPGEGKVRVILHPKSKGSAKEWGLENFSALIGLLDRSRYQVFISGTKEDADRMRDWLNSLEGVTDICGRLSLSQFIAFTNDCDALVAASTGPLHIAAALGKKAIGLFTARRPMHPGRWAPVGPRAAALVYDERCEKCRAGKDCDCITKIDPSQIVALLEQ
jgi:heptosyltransferase III